jgi:8-oxo-dGTP diphosphatase
VLRDVIETIAASPLLLVAAAAIVDADHRILVQQRPPGKSLAGLWEFPGGKIEAGESPEAALVREIGEELGVTIEQRDLVPATFASAQLEVQQLVMLVYLCRRWTGDAQPLHASALRWCHIDELASLPMPPADAPLIPLLAAMLESIG